MIRRICQGEERCVYIGVGWKDAAGIGVGLGSTAHGSKLDRETIAGCSTACAEVVEGNNMLGVKLTSLRIWLLHLRSTATTYIIWGRGALDDDNGRRGALMMTGHYTERWV